jgi:hypothetical protein
MKMESFPCLLNIVNRVYMSSVDIKVCLYSKVRVFMYTRGPLLESRIILQLFRVIR